jgi:pimeloyl-ACP methyl ester carboxylesterase
MPRPIPRPNTKTYRPTSHPPVQFEAVDPVWLLKALGVCVLAALACGYLTFCLLFYQGQWQLVLHPTRTTSSPSSVAGIPYEIIHFGPDESAIPQLTGWWIPADPAGRYAHFTILFLSGANGSVTDSVPTLAALHHIGVNVFAFDYRGYGQSAATHPNQQNMIHDADSAWQYLTGSRAIPAQQIIPYGFNVGASLAAHLSIAHPASPALILDSPYADLLDAARRDPRSHLLPVSLLFRQHFPLAEPLSTLHTPKLLLSRPPAPDEAFPTAAGPKVAVKLTAPSEAAYEQSVSQFLNQYLHPVAAPRLVPSPAPVH